MPGAFRLDCGNQRYPAFSVPVRKYAECRRVMSPDTCADCYAGSSDCCVYLRNRFYTVKIQMDGFTASTERIKSKEDAEKLAADCKEASAVVAKVERKNRKEKPPLLYDLTTLSERGQTRSMGYTAQQTFGLRPEPFMRKRW